jgi:hypothetical protein
VKTPSVTFSASCAEPRRTQVSTLIEIDVRPIRWTVQKQLTSSPIRTGW